MHPADLRLDRRGGRGRRRLDRARTSSSTTAATPPCSCTRAASSSSPAPCRTTRRATATSTASSSPRSARPSPTSTDRWTRIAADILGVTEETTTGVHRLYELAQRRASCCSPRSTSTTRSPRASSTTSTASATRCPDGLNRATDVLIGGKVAFVAGYGDVGKGAAEALRGQGARVIVSEVDPINALQAAMDGYQVAAHRVGRSTRSTSSSPARATSTWSPSTTSSA